MTHIRTLSLCTLMLAMGCTPDLEDRVSAANGATFFAENCAACHGADARGGIGPDLTTLAQQNAGTFPEIEAMATIYAPAYHQSRGTIMPEFGANDLGPLVVVEVEEGIGTPIPTDLIALSEYLRSVQR